ncbi:MAG: SDR family oxidoreductase [Pirellula sp.]|nr:SDR family oxidoreductase [Pirellula sp.]
MDNQANILVTGGSRGLGLAIVKRLSENNHNVVCLSRHCTPELDKMVSTCDRVKFFSMDLGELDKIPATIKNIITEYGPIKGLVNNAAIGRDGVLATMHEKDILETINVNITGTILLTRAVVRHMLRKRGGSIVNVSSIIASTGYNGLSVYAATKAAMLGFTRSLARELGRAQIRVNTVSPGYMATDMTAGMDEEKIATIVRRSPMGRLATTDEVASMVSYLMSEDSSAVTGANFVVDAGSTA